MDPDATCARWLEAVAAEDSDTAWEAHADLLEWLHRGGFPPDWSDSLRAEFMAWPQLA